MSLKRAILITLFGSGCLAASAISLFCVVIYIQTVVETWGANDRSMLFWCLPFLFAGVFLGIVACLAGLKLRSFFSQD